MGKSSIAEKAPPLKAYTVLESGEGTGGIVFARHSIVARREGASQFADGDFHSVTCTRTKWADRYAEVGDVPIEDMVLAGWHFECSQCGARIDTDYLTERDWRASDIIGTQHSTVYCNAVCEARQALHKAEAEYHQQRWIRRFRKIVKRRFPDAVLVAGEGFTKGAHAYASKDKGRWTIQQVAVSFEFPGMEVAPATLRYYRSDSDRWRKGAAKHAKPEWSCCYGDKSAFEAYASHLRPTPSEGEEA